MMKPRDQSLTNFRKIVTNQQENPCEDSGFSNNQDPPHLQNICCRNSSNHFDEDGSQQPQPLLRTSHKDQSQQPNFHHGSQEAGDLQQQLFPCPACRVKGRAIYTMFETTSANNHRNPVNTDIPGSIILQFSFNTRR